MRYNYPTVRFNSGRPARRMLMAGSAVAFGLASPAMADEAPGAARAAIQPSDIVVTAQRREQRLQDVGIAVTVLSAKTIKALNITNATDITRAIPNLRFNAYGSSQVVFNMRGVSQNDYGDQQEVPVAVYQDDSYASSIGTASFPIFDLARTEALRGPQGTLFGRNATGGAVQFISSQPTKDFTGYLTGTYGRYNQTIIEGALSGPLAPDLTARIAGQYDRDDGYIKDITPGQPNRGGDNHWAVRGILAFEPDPTFKAKLTLRYARADHERQAGLYTLAPACPNTQYQGEFLATNTVCPYWGPPGSSAPGLAAPYFYTNNGVAGSVANGYTNPAITPSQGGNPWTTAGTNPAYVNRAIFGATMRFDLDLGPVSVTSISDYSHLNKFYIEGGDGDPELPYIPGPTLTPATGPCAAPAQAVTCYASGTIFYQSAHVNQMSQEVRASLKSDRNYLNLGVYGLVIDGKFGAKYATPFDQYDPIVAIRQTTESYAVFGQDEYKISDQLKLIGGLRYWHDHKVGNYSASEAFSGLSLLWGDTGIAYNDPTGITSPASYATGQTCAAPLAANCGITVTPAAARPSFSGLTARAEIDFKPSPDTLLYASYNRGSKSGGFTFSTGTPTLGQATIDTINNIPYRPETLNDYEVGLKASLPGHTTFDVAGYYYNYQNYQAFVQVGLTQVVRNLPATAYGVEADLNSNPIRGLTLRLAGSFEHSEVKNILLPDGATLVNHSLPQAPSFSGNALVRYEFPLAGGTASLQGDALYQSHMCFTVLCAPVENERAYHTENARIGFTPAGGMVDLAFFVNNIFNRAYRVYAYDGSLYWGDVLGVYGKPRTWGVTATVHFGAH